MNTQSGHFIVLIINILQVKTSISSYSSQNSECRCLRRDPLNAETLSRGMSKPLDSPTRLWQAGSLTIRILHQNQWLLSQSSCRRLFKWHCGSRAQVRVSAEARRSRRGELDDDHDSDAMRQEGRRAERRAVEPRATAQYMRRLGHDSYSACPYNIRTKMRIPGAHRLGCPRGQDEWIECMRMVSRALLTYSCI